MKFKAFKATKSFIFKDPDTGYEFNHPTRRALVRHIVQYRAQNALEQIENLDAVLENYWCSLPENCGSCEDAPLKRGFLQYLKGGIALVKSMAYKEYASQKEADRRAEICIKCPYNVFPDKNAFVRWSDGLALEVIGNRRAVRHNELGNCSVCSCPLRVKVWFMGNPELSPSEIQQMKAVNCWQPDLQK